METIGFTGTRHLRGPDWDRISGVVAAQTRVGDVLITGACVGADIAVAFSARELGRTVHTVVPANRAQVHPEWWRHCTTHEEMPVGTDYRARNERIVDLSDRLIAFPEYPERHPQSRRSGTWMTVRIALRNGKLVTIYVLNQEGIEE